MWTINWLSKDLAFPGPTQRIRGDKTQRSFSPGPVDLAADSVRQPLGGNWHSAWTRTPGNGQWSPRGFCLVVCLLLMNEDTCTDRSWHVSRSLFTQSFRWRQRFILTLSCGIRTLLMRTGWGHSRRIAARPPGATRQMVEEVTLVSEGFHGLPSPQEQLSEGFPF